MKKVTIIIPTFEYERAEETVDCLEKQSHPTKVIVVDRPDLNIAEARNRGIKQANSEIVGFTDDDCYPHEDWVEKAVRNFDSQKVAGVEGETYGGLERIYPWGYMSCNIFYRRNVLKKVGGFDIRLSGWRDDTDLAWRVLKKDYQIKYEPEAWVYHPDKPRSEPRGRNNLLLLKKHPLRFIKNELVRKPISIIRRRFIPAHLGGSRDNLWNRFISGKYEGEVINFYKKHSPFKVSVDIGAGIGYHTRELAKISKKVIAIEPINKLIDMPDNVEIHEIAVGGERRVRKMEVYGGHSAGHLNAGFGESKDVLFEKEVEVVPLDEIIEDADFLKVDVEGHELEVLESSSILDSIDYAVIEIHENANLADFQRKILNLLGDFRVYASELKSYVTADDSPLKGRTNVFGEVTDNANTHRLLCERVG